jgi:hypothetical protein
LLQIVYKYCEILQLRRATSDVIMLQRCIYRIIA